MNNKIEGKINHLNELAKGGIKEDKFNHEFKDIIDTLESIKSEHSKGEPSKEQLKKIISFLDNQIRTIPNGNFVMTNELNSQRKDFQKLLNNFDKEIVDITSLSKKERNQIIDENIAKGNITEEQIQKSKKIEFKEKDKKTFEESIDLKNFTNYTVKSGDRLWDIVKSHYPKLTKTNKDIIHIVNYIVNLNLKLNPKKLKHLERDDKLAWGVKGSDGIAGDNIRIGDIIKLPKIKDLKKERPITKKKDKKETPPIKVIDKKEAKDTVRKNTEETESNTYVDHYIFEDGRVLLIGEDGEKKEFSRELSKEELEKIEKFKKVAILNEVLDIWKTEANNVVDGLFWKSARNDDEIILKQISGIEKDFAALFSLITTNKLNDSQINKSINDIFNKIQLAESEESIIGSSDMKEVKKVLLSNSDKDSKLIKIFNLMRYKGLSGNSNTVKEKVANHLLTQKEFKSISEILNNKDLLPYIENNNKEKLTKLFGNENLAEQIIESYNKIKVKQEEHREDYSKILKKINAKKRANNETEISLNDFIKLNVDFSIQTLVKHTLIESQIDSMTNRGSENSSYTGIYANLSGLAPTSSGDILVIADENIDTAIDIGTTLAISAISMGVGALAARGAMMAVNYGSKALKIGKATTRIGSLARFGGTATIEGTSFYMGTNTMNNLIYGNFEGYNIGENNLNGKEIIKSIAFMGVLKATGNLMKGISDAKFKKSVAGSTSLNKNEVMLNKIGDLTAKVPPLMFKNTSIMAILVEAGLLTSTSVGLEVAFEGKGEFTIEEYLQAIVMVGLLKSVGRNGKNPDKIKIIKEDEKIKMDVITKLPKNQIVEVKGKDGLNYTLRTNSEGKITRIEHLETGKQIKTKDANKWVKENIDLKAKSTKTEKKETSKESKKYKEALNDALLKIKDTPEIIKKIDSWLSSRPYNLNKLYNFPKWFVYNSEKGKFRSIPAAIGNSIKTPYDVIKNFKKSNGFEEHAKNILFANKDISFINGLLKAGGYALAPSAIEELYKYNTIEGYQIKLSPSDLAKDYAALMYLGVVNTLILEYLNNDSILED